MPTTSVFACSWSLHESKVFFLIFLFYYIFYGSSNIQFDEELITGLYGCIVRLVPSQEMQDKIMSEMYINKTTEGLFGIPLAIRSMTTKDQGYLFKLYIFFF